MSRKDRQKKANKLTAPPVESRFGRKQREQRLGLRPTVHDLQPEAEPAFRDAVQNKTKEKLSTPYSKAGRPMITDAYRGGSSVAFQLTQEVFPSRYNEDDAKKPCFLVAEVKGGEWHVTRYIGDILNDGTFEGQKVTKSIGTATSALQKQIFYALIDWTSNQNQRYLVHEQKPFMDSAQKIFARRSPILPEPRI